MSRSDVYGYDLGRSHDPHGPKPMSKQDDGTFLVGIPGVPCQCEYCKRVRREKPKIYLDHSDPSPYPSDLYGDKP